MKHKLLCTLGPTSMAPAVIGELAELGTSLFRVNLSHTALEDVEPTIRRIQAATDVPVCLDTEGARFRSVAPALTVRDREALQIGLELGVQDFALSFAASAEDIAAARELIGDRRFLIAKIESRAGVENMNAIARDADALLVDRGDLSEDIPVERIPKTQALILERGAELGIDVYVATNLLETMVREPRPTLAEANDVYNTLKDGAAGLVLAGETAIGYYPVLCARFVCGMIREFETEEQTA